MTQLGPGFLKAYYRTVLDCEGHIFLVVENEGQPVGFVAGFTNPSAFYALLRQRKIMIGLAIVPAVLCNPALVPRLIGNARRVSDFTRSEGEAELASICVLPDVAGKGFGKLLVEAFIKEARSRGARSVYLTTDAEHNDYVNRFYQRLGFEKSRTLLAPGNRLMNEYRMILTLRGEEK